MQNEDRLRELYRVDRPVRTACIIFDNLKDASTAETLERLCGAMPIATLGKVQRMAKEFAHICRKRHQIFLASANPDQWSLVAYHAVNLYHLKYKSTQIPG